MPLQYLYDETGQATAVLIPIEERKAIREKFQDIAVADDTAPKTRKKPSDFKGILSPETADAVQEYVKQSREEWD